MIGLIWAESSNKVIGLNGQMPWNNPLELRHFKAVTLGTEIVMGRKTWDSLNHRQLPDRETIVVSETLEETHDGPFVITMGEYIDYAKQGSTVSSWCIGGTTLFESIAPYARRAYVTRMPINVPLSFGDNVTRSDNIDISHMTKRFTYKLQDMEIDYYEA